MEELRVKNHPILGELEETETVEITVDGKNFRPGKAR